MDAVMSVLAPVLEALFFVGLAGSAIVVAISFIEDAEVVSGKHDK